MDCKCPHCNLHVTSKDEISYAFGWRRQGKKIVPQSWCNKCRNEQRNQTKRRLKILRNKMKNESSQARPRALPGIAPLAGRI